MGHAPSKPNEAEAALLTRGASEACERAAEAIANADVLLVCIGNANEPRCAEPRWSPARERELFYGHWGARFNATRRAAPDPAYGVIAPWCARYFEGTPASAWLREQQLIASYADEKADSSPPPRPNQEAEKTVTATTKATTTGTGEAWKASLLDFEALQPATFDLLDLSKNLGASDDEDEDDEGATAAAHEEEEEALANRPYDSHGLPGAFLPGAFHLFTSATDGHAARLLGRQAVRECRGSVQLWQCAGASAAGSNGAGVPCRADDVWEAPDGYLFRLEEEEEEEEEEVLSKAGGERTARPPPRTPPPPPRARGGDTPPLCVPALHVVPMWQPACMDRALSVAEAFRANHPKCRSCGGPARPALVMQGGDCGWQDGEQRAARYAAWRRAVCGLGGARPAPWAGGSDSRPARIVVVEIGASHPCDAPRSTDDAHGSLGPSQRSGSTCAARGAGLVWTTVRRESEAFVAEINAAAAAAATPGSIPPPQATLVRINETWPLLDRSGGGGGGGGSDAAVAVAGLKAAMVSVMLSTHEALVAIDAALRRLRPSPGSG